MALLATTMLAACGGSNNGAAGRSDGGKKDGGPVAGAKLDGGGTGGTTGTAGTTGTPSTGGTITRLDAGDAPAPSGCIVNGETYDYGATVTIAGACPQTCMCLVNGTVGQCTGGCGPEAGTPPDTRPPVDTNQPRPPDTNPSVDTTPSDTPVVTCTRNGKVYSPGEVIPSVDACGGQCVCLSNGTIGACTGMCPPDAGPDANQDRPPDGPSPDTNVDRNRDTAIPCTNGTACNLANGAKGLCRNSVCSACTSVQDDATCATNYGAGYICADGLCVIGTCHDSTPCKTNGNKVCDAAHTCQACTSNLQCQNDAAYGRNSVCLANGQCVSGNCRTSSDCQGRGLCDATTHTCAACTADTQCQADTVYGTRSICVGSQCVDGSCTTTTNCRSGRLCTGPAGGKICTACTSDTQCKNDAIYGTNTICASGQCVSGSCTTSSECTNGRVCNTTSHVCVACTGDTQCRNDAAYGQGWICLSSTSGSACTRGNCHDTSADCTAGYICGASTAHTCGFCTSDAKCAADTRYQTGYVCINSLCVAGNCHATSAECSNTQNTPICNALFTCSACANDNQCLTAADGTTLLYPNTICNTTPGSTTRGRCVSNNCAASGTCLNEADVCCPNAATSACMPGNCCDNADCAVGSFCRNNTCTSCDAVGSSRQYFVDPVSGDDNATGSRTSGGGTTTAACAFRTLTKALSVVGSRTATTAATITIIGGTNVALRTSGTAPVETLPIPVTQSYVTINTQTGPVKLTLGNNDIGFKITGNNVNLTPLTSAPLTIEGTLVTGAPVSGSGIQINNASGVTISNVVINNPGDHGIEVTAGGTVSAPVTIDGGVHVTGAGIDGLSSTGSSVVNIGPITTLPATIFENGTGYGIHIEGLGVLNITGTTLTTGEHTVVSQTNKLSNVFFNQLPAAGTALSTINGLYSWASSDDGLMIAAGSKIKVRNSTFLGSAGSGIHIVPPEATGTNTLESIDLGAASATALTEAGNNTLQAKTGGDPSPNSGAGLCIEVDGANNGQVLMAAGNQFPDHNCASTASAAGTLPAFATNCFGQVDIGVIKTAPPPTITVRTNNCAQP